MADSRSACWPSHKTPEPLGNQRYKLSHVSGPSITSYTQQERNQRELRSVHVRSDSPSKPLEALNTSKLHTRMGLPGLPFAPARPVVSVIGCMIMTLSRGRNPERNEYRVFTDLQITIRR